MSGEEMPTSVWQGTLHLWGVDLKCHVLSTGQRVIEADSLKALMEAHGEDTDDERTLMEIARWIKGKGVPTDGA